LRLYIFIISTNLQKRKNKKKIEKFEKQGGEWKILTVRKAHCKMASASQGISENEQNESRPFHEHHGRISLGLISFDFDIDTWFQFGGLLSFASSNSNRLDYNLY